MLKFAGDTKESSPRPVLGIGICQEECYRLLKGESIIFSTDGMDGLPSMQVFILAGEDDKSIALELVRLGIWTGNQIRDDPSPSEPHAVRPADNKGMN